MRCFINGGCVAAETSMSTTRGVDTEDASNKDLVSDSVTGSIAGALPIALYKNRTFQVEAQGNGAINLYARAKALMTATGGAVGFAETSGENNRTGSPASYYQAICNDLVLNAPNRQPATCTAQFMVISDTASGTGDEAPAVEYEILRGEFVRLFIGDSYKPIALATGFSLHLSLNMEDATTKDDTSSMSSSSDLDYKKQEPTTINYDISVDSLYGGNGTAQDIAGLIEGVTYDWKVAMASGPNQWSIGETISSGQAMLTNAGTQAATSQNITQNATFTGVGVLDEDSSSNNSSDEL